MVIVQAAIFGQSEFEAGKPIELTFRVSNFGKDAARILKWLTPLEGLVSDCLRVIHNGRRVRYEGPLLKRAVPGESSYLTLGSGESVEVKLPLHTVYQVSEPGMYNVSLQNPIRVVSVAAIEALTGRDTPTEHLLFSLFTGVTVNISEAATSFQVFGEGERIPTLGERFRHKPGQSVITDRTPGVVLPPNFNGGDNASQAIVQQAHSNGYQLALNALGGMAQDSWYGEWFGDYTDIRFGAVQTHFNQVVSDMESNIFTYDLTGTNCVANTFAYTYPGNYTIWICSLFWTAPANGTDSQAGVIVHEHCHTSADLGDFCYGFDPCQQYAISNPDQAVANADSHEYYARG